MIPLLPIYYIGLFLCSGLGTFSNQKYARASKNSADFFVFALITGTIATVVFYVTSGFNIVLNARTCVYALLFALFIFINYFFGLAVFKFMGIAEATFVRSGISLTFTTLMGVFFFEEKFTLVSLAQLSLVFLTLLAVFLPSAKKSPKARSVTLTGLLLCVGSSVLGTLCSCVSKSFATDGGVTDENSFFFLTNVFIVAMAVVSVLVTNKMSPKAMGTKFKDIPLIGYLMIIVNVLSSNISSLLGIVILREGALILYAPLSSALGLLAGEAVAVFIAKEKPRIAATILALSSVLVVLLF